MPKPDPKSKDPKDESLVGETKDEDKEKEVSKNKEVSEIGSNNNNSMSKVNICKADDTSSSSLETAKQQNSLEQKTLLVINSPADNVTSLNDYSNSGDKKHDTNGKSDNTKSGVSESLSSADLEKKIDIPTSKNLPNDASTLDQTINSRHVYILQFKKKIGTFSKQN